MDDSGFSSQQKSQEVTPEMVQYINGDEKVKADIPGSDTDVIFAQLEDVVSSTAISPDGRRVVIGLDNGNLNLFDLITGTQIGQSFRGHKGSVKSVAFSPDGQTILSGCDNIRLWSLDGNLINEPFGGDQGYINTVAFALDGQTIISCTDTIIQLWSLDGNLISEPYVGDIYASSHIWSIAFSPDGQTIVIGSSPEIKLWSLKGVPIGKPFFEKGKFFTNTINSVAFSPNGQTIVSVDKERTICRWSLDGKLIGEPFQAERDYGINSVSFSPNGQTILGCSNNNIKFWSLNGKLICDFYQGESYSLKSVLFSPDGKFIVSGIRNTILLWSIDFSAENELLKVTRLRHLGDRSRRTSVPQGIANDLAQGKDQLKVKDEIDALATVLMLRSLQPPVAIGILGNWGSGKSFGMYLLQQKVNEIRIKSLTLLETWDNLADPHGTRVLSPFVGHIYQIQFNAWTYAKSNLWASLMQEIFYELNHQVSLEQQLGQFLYNIQLESSIQINTQQRLPEKKQQPLQYLDQYFYSHLSKIKKNNSKKICQIYRNSLEILRILDLWLFQLFIHSMFLLVVVFVLPITIFSDFFIDVFLRKNNSSSLISIIIEMPFVIFSFLKTFIRPAFLNEIESYYFPELNFVSNSLREKAEAIAERTLFFLFVGFPRRLHDRRKFWDKKFIKISLDNTRNLKTQILSPTQKPDLSQKAQILCQGGKIWQMLYLREEERNAFLKEQLNTKQFQEWKAMTTASINSNSLWTTLDHIKQEEQERLKTTEEALQNKEKELQRQLKSAEVEVDQRLSRRAGTALWTPLVHSLARLRFSKEQVESFAASGQTSKLLRQTIKSWQGLLALFLMGVFIVVTTSPEGWDKVFALIQPFLKDSGLVNQIKRFIPTWVNEVPTWAKSTFQWMQKNIPTWLQIGTATIVALIPALKALGEYIASVQKEQARIQSERDGLLKQSQSTSESLSKEIAQLKLQVEEQRKKLGLTANYSSLLDFVNARLDGDDYGKHLGLMQQVKQDLAALSDRLTVGAHNQEELKKFFPRGPARVILYIDDLDRCPPTRVVEVLEAVQLLLNTKLFIVVLGIDDRYIARALEEVYKGVLKRGGKPSGIDYLEKIIQIPYRMRPISAGTVESYLRAQLQIRQPSASDSTQLDSQSNKTKPQEPIDESSIEHRKTDGIVPPEVIQVDSSAFSSESPDSSLQDSQPTVEKDIATPASENSELQRLEYPSAEQSRYLEQSRQTSPEDDETKSTPTDPPTPIPSISYLETIAQVTEFDEAEFQILVDCCKQVDITPRTAKRLINIYKILQIIWTTRSQEPQRQDLPSEQQKRVVMSFLALSGRYPTFMRNLFEEIDVLLEEQTLDETQECNADNPQLQKTLSELITLISPQIPSKDVHARREWRKFISDIQRMLKAPTQPKEKPVELNIDRQTFELMLSFCFVGDIGYDPDDYSVDAEPRDKPQ
jgi:sulfur relay (sulfurtransferase) DsrC/TusE family protein